VRRDWLNKSAMVSTGQVGAMLAAIWLDLPALPTMVSATILGITATDPLAMGQKAYLRGLGAALGGGYALVSMILLAYLPDFGVLAALVFFGMFLASYFTKMSVKYSYAFMQMGLALPMVLIGSSGELGSLETAVKRLIGVGAGLVIAEVVFVCWPQQAAIAAAPAPVTPSAEVVKPGG
jgi:Aluminium activated malate transporter